MTFLFTKEGYFKKITPQSLRMSAEQKLKEGDALLLIEESSNKKELLFFTDQCQVYKSRASDFSDTKASVLGDYIPTALQFDSGEKAVYMAVTEDYSGYMVFIFENGKAAKVEMKAYETKTNRKKLLKAYSGKSPLVAAFYLPEDRELLLTASSGRMLLFHTGAIAAKSTKDTQGVQVMTLKKSHRVIEARLFEEGMLAKPHRHRIRSLPAAGSMPAAEEAGDQLSL